MIHANSAEPSALEMPLKLEGIKDSYIFPEPVTLKVTNITQSIVMYGAGIQKQEGEKWQDFMTNMDDHEPIRMAFKVRKINEHESQILTWEPKFIPNIFGSKKGIYRVYLILDVGENDHKKFYSETFEISELHTPTIAPEVPIKNKRWTGFSAMNATYGSKARLHQTKQPNGLPPSYRCPG